MYQASPSSTSTLPHSLLPLSAVSIVLLRSEKQAWSDVLTSIMTLPSCTGSKTVLVAHLAKGTMDRGRTAMPTLNKHTDGAAYERSMKIHKDKLLGIKSSIDTTAPPPRMHLRKNLKKEQMMEENYAKIERENRILLSKMSNIMQVLFARNKLGG